LKRKEEKEVAPITNHHRPAKYGHQTLFRNIQVLRMVGAGKFYSLCDRSCLKCIALTFYQNPPHHTHMQKI
jgi:hypothetical protein